MSVVLRALLQMVAVPFVPGSLLVLLRKGCVVSIGVTIVLESYIAAGAMSSTEQWVERLAAG